MNKVFMSRQPLLNRQSRIIASRLTLHLGKDGSMQDAASALGALDDIWPRSEKPVFISCGDSSCDAGLLDWSTPENAALELPAAALLGPDGPDLISALQTWQPTTCLLFDAQAQRFHPPQQQVSRHRVERRAIDFAVVVDLLDKVFAAANDAAQRIGMPA